MTQLIPDLPGGRYGTEDADAAKLVSSKLGIGNGLISNQLYLECTARREAVEETGVVLRRAGAFASHIGPRISGKGGQKQRVLFEAIVDNPEVITSDEHPGGYTWEDPRRIPEIFKGSPWHDLAQVAIGDVSVMSDVAP
ncbi:NUDIX hydrolase [Candidatus Saccharibacteria bacterium]|nr:MAG: NUDIX hydrolase [Candidatus Saccharibacteria bacterium]